jgi:uncharacterized protein (DUF3820 family)
MTDRELIMWELPMVEMPFGKYRGKSIKWIAEHDEKYLEWLEDEALTWSKSKRLLSAINYYVYHTIPKSFDDLDLKFDCSSDYKPKPKIQPKPKIKPAKPAKFGDGFRD